MEAYVNQQREMEDIWLHHNVDGWTGPTRLSIINFTSVDASNNIKDHKYIYKLLKNVIKEVGVDNVVQIVINNKSMFVKAGKVLMKNFNLYWTPCVAYCINLMFEDIGKRPSVANVICSGHKITNIIYNHGWLLAKMRKYCGGDIVRLGATRWVKKKIIVILMGQPIYLDDEVGNPNPQITTHAREFGVDVECVLSKEVHSESFTKDTRINFKGHWIPTKRLTPQYASSYDGSKGGTDDGGDNTREDIGERQQSQYPMSQFTYENDFTHCTQDEDHGSRRVGPGIGAIGKPYRGRERTMTPYNEELLSGSFESMSIGTQFSDSSNEANVYPPYVMGYGQPSSSIDEEYGISSYPSNAQLSYQLPYQMQGGFHMNTWVNLKYPIHVEAVGRTQEIYAWHVRIFNQYY
ncbi:hypothetical protein AAG906_033341 [Vitis piasezkii]